VCERQEDQAYAGDRACSQNDWASDAEDAAVLVETSVHEPEHAHADDRDSDTTAEVKLDSLANVVVHNKLVRPRRGEQ